MANLYFENSNGGRRVIANCHTEEEVIKAIYAFIDTCNKGKPKDKKFKSYYTREWVEDGQTWYDVGSHTEFFLWDKVINHDNKSGSSY